MSRQHVMKSLDKHELSTFLLLTYTMYLYRTGHCVEGGLESSDVCLSYRDRSSTTSFDLVSNYSTLLLPPIVCVSDLSERIILFGAQAVNVVVSTITSVEILYVL